MKTIFILLMIFPAVSVAWHDPTEGKPFFPWVWEDNLKPTFKKAVDGEGVTILATGIATTFAVRPYDHKIYDHNKVHGDMLIGRNEAKDWGKAGNGMVSLAAAGLQLAFNEDNGIKTIRAMLLTSTTHITISAATRRNRPDNRTDFLPWPSSFPSGHTANAFALAGSMAYSYGWYGAIPGYTFASMVGLSRIKESRHWASDVVSGAFVGTFWAHASFRAKKEDPKAVKIFPMPVDGEGMMLMAVKQW